MGDTWLRPAHVLRLKHMPTVERANPLRSAHGLRARLSRAEAGMQARQPARIRWQQGAMNALSDRQASERVSPLPVPWRRWTPLG